MVTGINNNLGVNGIAGGGVSPVDKSGATGAGTSSTGGFADVLKNSIDDVARLQQDASQAVQDLATGRTEDMSGVMMAVEKSDMAFKTLLTIRAKLMDAYDEIKNMPL